MIEDSAQIAIFAAGCFWGVEHSFDQLDGVLSAESGYSGGHLKNPSYEQVCSGSTGHAEAVKVIFDPEKISYQQLLEHFWKIHDPTTFNRQGPDIGSQYRSAVFTTSSEQQKLAEESKQEAQRNFNDPIVTEVEPVKEFYRAEEYHQKYFQRRGISHC